MSSKLPTDERRSIRSLIELQRRLIGSRNFFLRRIGALLGAGALDRQLSELRDKQVGQLMLDFVERDLAIAQPEAVICGQATRRESDFYECTFLGCEYKEYLDCDEPRGQR